MVVRAVVLVGEEEVVVMVVTLERTSFSVALMRAAVFMYFLGCTCTHVQTHPGVQWAW